MSFKHMIYVPPGAGSVSLTCVHGARYPDICGDCMSEQQVLILDSSQIAQFLECPKQWDYSSQQNLTLFMGEPKTAMLMGSFGHKLLERYYKFAGSVGDRIDHALLFSPESDGETKCSVCGIIHKQHTIEQSGHEFNPVPFDLSEPDRNKVRERFKEYCYVYGLTNRDFVADSPDSVEVGFSYPLLDTPSKLYILEGRIDLIGTYQSLHCVVDHKWQLKAKQLYKKSIQFRNYSMVINAPMLIVNYIRLGKDSKETFNRDIVNFTSLEHQIWKQRLIQVFDRVLESRRTGIFDQNWSSCSGRYSYPCEFTQLCDEVNRDLIPLKIQQMYKQKEEWKPW